MSTPIEDFIISLGFDTKAISSQITQLHQQLEKLSIGVNTKSTKQTLNTQKVIADNEIKSAKNTAKAKEKIQTEADKKRIASEKQTSKTIASTRKQAALTALRNQIAEYERSTTGPSNLSNRYKYYERGNASIPKIKAFTEEIRGKNVDTRNRMKSEGSLKSFDNASAAKAEMDMMKASHAMEVLRTRMVKMDMDTSKVDKDLVDAKDLTMMKRLIEQTKHQINLEKELNKGRTKAVNIAKTTAKMNDSHVAAFQKQQIKNQKLAEKAPSKVFIRNQVAAMQTTGAFGGLTPQQRMALQQSAAQQSTRSEATSYLNTGARLGKYAGLQQNKVNIKAVIESGNLNAMKQAVTQLSAINAEMGRMQRRAISAATAMNGLQDSTRNMVREYASLYAIFAGTGAIKEQAKALDGMNAGMVAVSENATEAQRSIKFITDEALKNGLTIKEASKDYVKLKAAIGDKLGITETEQMFQALTKAGVVFQLSQDDMSGSIKAVSQMFAKGAIQAEEMKNQLGDRMPIAMRALEKSTGKSAKELMKMMEMGQLSSEYIMPMVMALGELADANGAYSKALTKVGTVENRMKTSAGVAAGRIADAGFTKGLVNLYETMMKAMNDNGKSLDRLGKIYEKVFNAIAKVIEYVVVPVLSLFLRTIESVYKAIQWGVDNPIGGMIIAVGALGGAFRAVVPIISSAVMVMTKVLKGPMGVIMALMSAIDEIRGVFDENVIGLGENEKASAEDRKIAAANGRVFSGIGTEADKKLLSGLSAERINQAKANNAGALAFMGVGGQGSLLNTFPAFKAFNAMYPNAGKGDNGQFRQEHPKIANFMEGYIKLLTAPANLAKSAGQLMFSQNIIINGNVSEDNIQQIKEQTKKVMDDYSNLNTLGGF